jgi:hypothetical protein
MKRRSVIAGFVSISVAGCTGPLNEQSNSTNQSPSRTATTETEPQSTSNQETPTETTTECSWSGNNSNYGVFEVYNTAKKGATTRIQVTSPSGTVVLDEKFELNQKKELETIYQTNTTGEFSVTCSYLDSEESQEMDVVRNTNRTMTIRIANERPKISFDVSVRNPGTTGC